MSELFTLSPEHVQDYDGIHEYDSGDRWECPCGGRAGLVGFGSNERNPVKSVVVKLTKAPMQHSHTELRDFILAAGAADKDAQVSLFRDGDQFYAHAVWMES